VAELRSIDVEKTPDFPLWLFMRSYAPRTVVSYTNAITRMERWLRRRKRPTLRSASWEDVRDYAASIPLTYATRSNLQSALKAYWSWLDRRDCPAWAVQCPKKPDMLCKTLEADELERVLMLARSWAQARPLGMPRTMTRYLWPAVTFMYYVGLRREETVTRRWSDVDEDGWLHIVGKGGREASLPLHPEVVSALEPLDRYESKWIFPGRLPDDTGQDVRLASATLNNWVRFLGATAGVPRLTPHVFRHTSLTNALDKTQNLRAVMTFARHSDPKVTAGYTRTRRSELVEIVSLLDISANEDEDG
jgi:integrase